MEENKFNHDRNHAELRHLGLQLKEMRCAANLSIDDVVSLSNGELKRGTISAIERGSYNAGVRHLMLYARMLGCRIHFVKDETLSMI